MKRNKEYDLGRNHVIDMYKDYIDREMASNPNYYQVNDRVLRVKGVQVLCKKNSRGKEEVVMSYTIFRSIIEKCNKLISDALLVGEKFYFGHSLGYIEGARIERNFEKKKVNFGETNRMRAQTGDNSITIYHTDNSYCRISWQKLRTLSNSNIYEFLPAKKFKNIFSTTLTKNPSLKFLFTFYKRYKS